MSRTVTKFLTYFFISFIVFAVIIIATVFYAPFKLCREVRDVYIETAMTTLTHQWLATMFFDEQTIKAVMLESEAANLSENTFADKIRVNAQNGIELKDIKGENFSGKLLIVKDSSRVKIAVTSKFMKMGEKIETLVQSEDAIGGINGSGFVDENGHGKGGVPIGILIKDGKVLYNPRDGRLLDVVGFNKGNVLMVGRYTQAQLAKLDLRDAVSPYYILMVNGETRIKEGRGGRGIQPRTAIGQTSDGTVLMLVIDGRRMDSIGATMKQVQDIMVEYGAVNAVALDGGSSTIMYYMDKIQNKPSSKAGSDGRWLPSAFVIKK